MDEEEYEEAFEEYAPKNNRWLWILLTLAVIAAIAFGILWHLRGEELARQTAAMQTAQTAADSNAARLRQDADDARAAASANTARITELENSLRDEQRKTTEAAAEFTRLAQTQPPDASQSEALQTAQTELETMRGQLAEAQRKVSELEPAAAQLAAANESLRQAERARAELEEQYGAGRTAGNAMAGTGTDAAAALAAAEAAAEETRTRLAQTEKRASDAENAVAELKKQQAEQSAKLEERLAEANRNIATLEKTIGDLEAKRNSLITELTSTTDDARQATADLDALRKAAEEVRSRAEKAEQLFREREKELRDDFERQKGEWKKQLEAAGQDSGQARAEEKKETGAAQPASATAAPATEQWSYVEGGSAPAAPAQPIVSTEPPAAMPRHVLIGDPNRSLGRVGQILTDGTYVVNGGANQRVKPGMVYDVHRRFSGMNRYIGLLLVTRVLDDFSLAVPAYPTGEARICPVTGRVVLDPARKSSPYVEVEGGKPVPLISAASLGLGLEMPAIGDCIDNPYYDPGRSAVFFAGSGMAGDLRVPELIEGIGGVMTNARASSDFEVVRAIDPGINAPARPRQVTVDALAMYYVKPAEPAGAAGK